MTSLASISLTQHIVEMSGIKSLFCDDSEYYAFEKWDAYILLQHLAFSLVHASISFI